LRKLLYIGILVIVMFFSTAEARANTVDDSFEKATSVEEAGVMDLDIIKITAGILQKNMKLHLINLGTFLVKQKKGCLLLLLFTKMI